MGRKVNPERLAEVIQAIQANDGNYKMNDVAQLLGLHPEAIARLLSATEHEGEQRLYEDDHGFLSIFKKWW